MTMKAQGKELKTSKKNATTRKDGATSKHQYRVGITLQRRRFCAFFAVFFFVMAVLGTQIFPTSSYSAQAAQSLHSLQSNALPLAPHTESGTEIKDGKLSVEITNFAKPWIDPKDDLQFTVSITNGTKSEFKLSEIAVNAQNTVANSQYLLYYWFNNAIVSRPLFSFPAPETVASGEIKTVNVRVPRNKISWSTAEFGWGPRGIEACAVPSEKNLTQPLQRADLCDRSVTVVTTDQKINPMPVAVSYPLTLNASELAEKPSATEILTSETKLTVQSKESSTDSDQNAQTATTDTTQQRQPETDETQPETSTQTSDEAENTSANITENTAAAQILSPNSAVSDLPVHTVQRLTQTIKNLQLPSVTLFIDPALLADTSLKQEIETATKTQKLLLPYADVDIQALISANAQDQLSAAVNLGNQIKQTSGLERSFAAEAIAVLESAPEQTTVDTLAEMGISTAIVPRTQRFVTHEHFYTQEATRKVSTNIDSENSTDADTSPESASSFTLLLSNDQISRALEGDLITYQDVKGINLSLNDRAQVALALSAIYFNEAPNLSRPLLVQISREIANTHPDSELAQVIKNSLSTLTQAPWLKASPLTAIINTDAAIHPLPDADQFEPDSISADGAVTSSPIQAEEITQMLQRRTEFLHQARIFTYYDEIASLTQDRTFIAYANSWRFAPDLREEYLQHAFDASVVAKGIKFEPSSTINMISESSSLPVRVFNSFYHDVQVQVSLVSPDQRLRSDKAVLATLPARQTTSVAIPVTAHGSGNIRVLLEILDSDGNPLGTQTYLNMRIRANWENTGTLILASLFGIVLVYGIYRSVRSGRRAQPMSQAEIEAGVVPAAQ